MNSEPSPHLAEPTVEETPPSRVRAWAEFIRGRLAASQVPPTPTRWPEAMPTPEDVLEIVEACGTPQSVVAEDCSQPPCVVFVRFEGWDAYRQCEMAIEPGLSHRQQLIAFKNGPHEDPMGAVEYWGDVPRDPIVEDRIRDIALDLFLPEEAP